MILHHYALSPFSEKIRAMLGYAEISWQSAISPAIPPRPIVDPLAGGYRRIPMAQMGADIFCDTRIISQEIATLASKPELSLIDNNKDIVDYVAHVDSTVFMAIPACGTPIATIGILLKNFTPWSAYRFIKDRAGIAKNMTIKRLSQAQAKSVVDTFVADLDLRVAKSSFVFTIQPTIADFAAYHVCWFINMTQGTKLLNSHPHAHKWFQKMSEYGHGQRTEINKKEVFKVAQTSEPRIIGDWMKQDPLISSRVEIMPSDYALDAVQGHLVGSDDNRWIVSRSSQEFGTLHVHFPKADFNLVEIA